MKRKRLEEMDLMDDFLMNQIISHPVYGERFSRIILGIILRRRIGKLLIMSQREYAGEDANLHGIRIDVYLDEEGSGIFDMEPDNNDDEKVLLPKRARFYHAKIDAGSFSSGMDYQALRDVTVIFITTYDPFGLKRMIYTISNQCREVPEMPYEDGAKSVFLYTKGTQGNCPEDVKKLLVYMEHSCYENAVTEELMEIHGMVTAVKRDRKVGLAYMKSYEIKQRLVEQVRKEERIRAEIELSALKAQFEMEKAELEREKDARIAELEKALQEAESKVQ